MKALRAWAAEVAATVNTGKYDSPKLDALMTPAVRTLMKVIAGTEVGRHYAGPVPFTPVRVLNTSPTARDIRICIVTAGFSTDPKTGKPKARKILPADAGATLSHGTWLVSKFTAGSFSCAGVTVPEPRS